MIAENKEKYISFSVNVVVAKYKDKEGNERERKIQLRFIDSIRFMGSSLDSLSRNLTDDQCKNLSKFHHGEEFQLMRRKGIYPYEYIDCWEKFNEDRLPGREEFYSRLNLRKISEKDYEHALAVWNHFKMKNLGEYHDRYLQIDVILLSDVFETIPRNLSGELWIRSCTFLHKPGISLESLSEKDGKVFSWNLTLSDLDMLLILFERGHTRRNYPGQFIDTLGQTISIWTINTIQKKRTASCNIWMPTNLYGWAMVQKR